MASKIVNSYTTLGFKFTAQDIYDRGSDIGVRTVIDEDTLEVEEITVSDLGIATGNSSRSVGAISTSGNVNEWSYFSSIDAAIGTSNDIVFTVAAPHGMGEFAGYNHNAIELNYEYTMERPAQFTYKKCLFQNGNWLRLTEGTLNAGERRWEDIFEQADVYGVAGITQTYIHELDQTEFRDLSTFEKDGPDNIRNITGGLASIPNAYNDLDDGNTYNVDVRYGMCSLDTDATTPLEIIWFPQYDRSFEITVDVVQVTFEVRKPREPWYEVNLNDETDCVEYDDTSTFLVNYDDVIRYANGTVVLSNFSVEITTSNYSETTCTPWVSIDNGVTWRRGNNQPLAGGLGIEFQLAIPDGACDIDPVHIIIEPSSGYDYCPTVFID